MHDVIRGGCELRSHASGAWVVPKDINRMLVTFVHGFTAHGRYLTEQANYVEGHDYYTAYFNYDSYLGIDTAAAKLAERLQACTQQIATHGLVLIGHSMGGLVVRSCAQFSLNSLKKYLRGIVLLGTPNNGTLSGRVILPRLLDWGDAVSRIGPYRRLATCRAAKQLTRSDPEGFLETLNDSESSGPTSFPTLTISGGLRWLELGSKRGAIRDRFSNYAIQRALGDHPNDGLVLEQSVDLAQVLGPDGSRNHSNSYSDYTATNHTALTANHTIGDLIVDFLRVVDR